MELREIVARAIWFSGFHPDDVSSGIAYQQIAAWHDDWEQVQKKAQAALDAINEAGFVIVPREPTEAMRVKGEELSGYCVEIYRAMIEASQEN